MSQDDITQLRSHLNLDFTLGPSKGKKSKYEICALETPEIFQKLSELNFIPNKKMKQNDCVLGTPDLQKIGISTPELDSLASKQFQSFPILQTPSNVSSYFKSQLEKEKPKTTPSLNNSSKPSKINNEFLVDNSTASLSRSENNQNQEININRPIDMVDQERIKLERKRYRNRIAASKCRQRKLEKISKLQEKVTRLGCKNDDLSNFMNTVQNIINRLNNHITKHKESGCDIQELKF